MHSKTAKPEQPQPPQPPALDWEKLFPVLLVVLGISLLSVWAMQALGGAEQMRLLVVGAGVWAPLVFILLKASTYVIAPLSGTPMKIIAGAVFGVWEGTVYAVAGDVLGGSLNFWIARLLGRPGIKRFAGAKSVKQVDETVQHVGGWRALLAARLILSGLYDFISYAAGLSNLPFKHYLWVTVLGGIPSALLYVFVGDALISGPGASYFLIGIIVIMSLVMLAKRQQKKKTPSA